MGTFQILGTGKYVPQRTVTNDEIATLVETSDEWIAQRVGVRERHVCVNETAADLAYEAALRALENSGCDASEIDLILAASVSGETVSPSIACMVQSRLGISCTAFDINAACSAFLFLLETAAGFFARGTAKKVLVIGAERMSRIVDWADRSTCVIFGDGAGAAVLGEGDAYLASTFCVKGGDTVIKIPQFAGKSPFYSGPAEPPYIQMNGQEVFRFAVKKVPECIRQVTEKTETQIETIDWFILHQANSRIIQSVAKRLGVPEEKFPMNMEQYGNTSAASIPILLDEMNKKGMLQPGQKIILSGFGAGLTWGAAQIEW